VAVLRESRGRGKPEDSVQPGRQRDKQQEARPGRPELAADSALALAAVRRWVLRVIAT
jgi:hypothetical protein